MPCERLRRPLDHSDPGIGRFALDSMAWQFHQLVSVIGPAAFLIDVVDLLFNRSKAFAPAFIVRCRI